MFIFDRFFSEPDDEANDRAEQRVLFAQILEFCRTDYYPILIRHLEEEALKPTPLTELMLQSAARANAFKEMREWLLGNQRRAERFMAARLQGE